MDNKYVRNWGKAIKFWASVDLYLVSGLQVTVQKFIKICNICSNFADKQILPTLYRASMKIINWLNVDFVCRFLGGNEIARVEGLATLNKLQELYIENQRLPVGDYLEFEPESLNAVAVSCLHRWELQSSYNLVENLSRPTV